MLRRSGIRRSRRIRAVSRRRVALRADYLAFVLGVKSRDGWRCVYCRTRSGALDPHHTTKRSQDPSVLLDADRCVTLCRACHDWTDASYASPTGRLVVTPLGGGLFGFEVIVATSKFQVRAAAGATVTSVGKNY